MIDATIEHDLSDDGGICTIRVNVNVDDDGNPDQAALAIWTAKRLMWQSHEVARMLADTEVPDTAESLTPPSE